MDLQAPILVQNAAMFNGRGNHLLGRFLLPPSSAPLLLEVDMMSNYSLAVAVAVAVVVVVVVAVGVLAHSMWSRQRFCRIREIGQSQLTRVTRASQRQTSVATV